MLNAQRIRRAALLAVFVAALIPAAFAADPRLLELMPPESRIVAGVHVDRTLASPFGQFVLSRMKQEDADFREFMELTGFDPRRDLREVVMGTVAGSKENGLVAVRGQFDLNRIFTAAKARGATAWKYKGVDVLGDEKDKTPSCAAFLDAATVVAGPKALVEAAIDRRGSGNRLDAKVAARVNEVSGRYDVWMVSMEPMSRFAGKLPDQEMNQAMKGNAWQSIEQSSGGVRFGSTVQIAGETVARSEKDATALADVVRFVVGMVQMNREKPEAAEMAAILDTMEVKAEGLKTKISLEIPQAKLEEMMKKMEDGKKASRQRRASL